MKNKKGTEKKGIKRLKEMIEAKERIKAARKDSTYAWLSLVLALFFFVPLLNVLFFLPASVYFGIKAMINTRRKPEEYGGFWVALASVIFASVSFVYALVILILSLSGKVPS